jgi:RNA 2',3'-cyclic 3'-phosphodiesterase
MRAFFALELPDDVRRRVAEAAADLAQSAGGVRVSREENLHVTLAFLGELAEENVSPLTTALASALQERAPFRLRIGGAGWFPPRGSPHVAWIGAVEGDEDGIDLAKRVNAVAVKAGINVDTRPPHIHVTVGRWRSGGRARELAGLNDWKRRWSAEPCGPAFSVDRVVLFESTLAPGGSIYAEKASVSVGG